MKRVFKVLLFIFMIFNSTNTVYAAPDVSVDGNVVFYDENSDAYHVNNDLSLSGTYTYYEWNCIQENGTNVKASDTIKSGTNYALKTYSFNYEDDAPTSCIGKKEISVSKEIILKTDYAGSLRPYTNSIKVAAKYNDDGTLTLQQPTMDGYEFLGWAGSNSDTPQIEVIISKDIESDSLSYTANWGKM